MSRDTPDISFDAAVRQHLSELQRFVGMLTNWSDDCDDLTSQVVTTAYEKWSHRPDDELLKSWLFQIARNHVRNHQKKERSRRQRHKNLVREISRLAGDNDDIDMHLFLLSAAFTELSDKEIQILTLFYWDELPALTICRLLSISESQVYVRLHRARSHLLAVMGRLERLGGEHD